MEKRKMDELMWNFQQQFQLSLQLTAETLFNLVDKRLKPSVFLVGILMENNKKKPAVCIEPDDYGYPTKPFVGIKKLAQELEIMDKEQDTFHSLNLAQTIQEKHIAYKAFSEAMLKILERKEMDAESEKFVSYPVHVNGYLVSAVLELEKRVLHRHYSLTKEVPNGRHFIPKSLILSSIDIFLKECSNALKNPYKDIEAIERDAEELMRDAGKQFMYTVSQVGGNPKGFHGLYEACNIIASLRYEGEEGWGKMVVASKNHPNVQLMLELKEPIKVSDFRKVRKFLELSDDDLLIISDSTLIYGIGKLVGDYDPSKESLFTIRFLSHFKWELQHDNTSMMIVEYKQPRLPNEKIDRDKFYLDLRRIFKGIEKPQLDDLWEITMEVIKQRHGTMLVITDNAKNEALRLGKQSLPLQPLKLTTGFVNQITSIDGSILLDRDGMCYAIGVILDGLATNKGDSSRGARYNSAVRYYEQFGKQNPTVIIIVSEDGMVNLIPFLKPQIDHSTITEKLDVLKRLGRTRKPNLKEFNRVMDFFRSMEFYLTHTEAKTINSLRKKIESRYRGSDTAWIVWNDLQSNSDMNDSYYSGKTVL
jgi:hypothetical protein